MSQRVVSGAGAVVAPPAPAAAEEAEVETLAGIFRDQLPIGIYDGDRLIGRMTGARHHGSCIQADIEIMNAAMWQTMRPNPEK